MTDQTGGSLNAAYEAIKAKDLTRARDLLSTYLVDQPNDVDAWWLYSYAVTDVAQARKALETVLRLDPAYPGARDLLTELEDASSSTPTLSDDAAPLRAAEATTLRPLSERPAGTTPLTTTITPEDDELSDFGIKASAAEGSSSSNRTILAIVAAIIVLLILAAVFIVPNLNPAGPSVADVTNTAAATDTSLGFGLTEEATAVTTDTADATAAATEAAPEATQSSEEPTLEATQETNIESTSEPSGDSLQSVYDALGMFEVVPDSAAVETTALGETLTASVCAATADLRSTIPAALTALALSSGQAPAEAQALGAKFVNCTDNTVLRYVAISIEDAQAYAAGTIDDATLRSRFVPLS